MKEKCKIYYLDLSGFAIQTKNNFYILDYFNDKSFNNKRKLSSGVINPNEIKDKNVYVFSTHSHHDHFNKVIFEWEKYTNNIKYILSYDIKADYRKNNIYKAHPGENINIDNLKISVLDSTDIGVSYYIEDNELSFFHSGDLNWWHWYDETPEYNKAMEINYKREINKLKEKHIDFSFIPVDPRLEQYYYIAIEYYLKNINTDYVFPIHFQSDYTIFNKLKTNLSKQHLEKVISITNRGQSFLIQ